MLNKGMLDSLCRVLGIRDGAAGDADDGDENEEDMFDVTEDNTNEIDLDVIAAADGSANSDAEGSDVADSDVEMDEAIANSQESKKEDEEELDLSQLTELLTDVESAEAKKERAMLGKMQMLKAQKRKEAEEMLRQTHHFKLRVLGLVELYISRLKTSPNVLMMALPLLNALSGNRNAHGGSTDKESLEQRTSSVLTSKLCKSTPELVPTDCDQVVELMTTLVARAQKTSRRDVQSQISQVLLWCMRLVRRMGQAQLKAGEADTCTRRGLELYEHALEAFVSRTAGRCINSRFFMDFISSFPELGWQLLNPLLALVSSSRAASLYHLHESWELVNKIFSNRGLLRSQPEVRNAFFSAADGFRRAFSITSGLLMSEGSTQTSEAKFSAPDDEKNDEGSDDNEVSSQSDEEEENVKKPNITKTKNAGATPSGPTVNVRARWLRQLFKIALSCKALGDRTPSDSTPEFLPSNLQAVLLSLNSDLLAQVKPALLNFFNTLNWPVPDEWDVEVPVATFSSKPSAQPKLKRKAADSGVKQDPKKTKLSSTKSTSSNSGVSTSTMTSPTPKGIGTKKASADRGIKPSGEAAVASKGTKKNGRTRKRIKEQKKKEKHSAPKDAPDLD
jgi:hypothetical protein